MCDEAVDDSLAALKHIPGFKSKMTNIICPGGKEVGGKGVLRVHGFLNAVFKPVKLWNSFYMTFPLILY